MPPGTIARCAPERTSPFTQPKVETMIAAAIARAAPGPKRAPAAAVPTRSSEACWTPESPSASRYDTFVIT